MLISRDNNACSQRQCKRWLVADFPQALGARSTSVGRQREPEHLVHFCLGFACMRHARTIARIKTRTQHQFQAPQAHIHMHTPAYMTLFSPVPPKPSAPPRPSVPPNVPGGGICESVRRSESERGKRLGSESQRARGGRERENGRGQQQERTRDRETDEGEDLVVYTLLREHP